MATWPTTLPAPSLQGYQLSPGDQSLRSDMESGAARSRRVTFARIDRVQVSWIFTDAQMDAFRTWFENSSEAAGGSAWFTVSLRVGNTGATSQEARFIGAFQGNLLKSDKWAVSAQWEVRDV